MKGGIEEFKRHKYRGNRFAALHTSKNLTVKERLRLENMKLKIKNEQLKRIHCERNWCKQGVHFHLRLEYQVTKMLSKEFSVKELCNEMNISR